MERLRQEGFVQNDSLLWGPSGRNIRLVGEIACLGNIRIRVYKSLSVSPSKTVPIVQTIDYSYTAVVTGYGRIVQVDGTHKHDNHEDAHHRHELDWRKDKDRNEHGRLIWLGEQRWPSLADFVREMHAWYDRNVSTLPDPGLVPTPVDPTKGGRFPDFVPWDPQP